MTLTIGMRAAVITVAIFFAFVAAWHIATQGTSQVQQMDPEYAKLMGVTATQGKSAMPGPLDVAAKLWEHARQPFYDNGPNDKGVGLQLAFSIVRVGIGYLIAVLVAIPIGFLIGMSPLMSRALDPFIQVLKPISPLAWMPLALYTIKDSYLSSIFVIFICSVWPMLINTAFGVSAVRKEWLNVAARLHHHSAGSGADHPHGNAYLHWHRLARHRSRRDARWRNRHRLLRLVGMEQSVDHQCDHGDHLDRARRHGARPDAGAAHPPRDVPGVARP
jgi:ABC-type nitrate/sulfonate/bicarbonate transport system permease component